MNEYDYIIDAFTKDGNNTNLEVDNLSVGCITSKNNNFSLDSSGNLTVNSITTQSGINLDFDLIYPVGSIYMSVSNTNPSLLFGGTWVAITDRFLIGASNTYQVSSEGGSNTAALNVNNIPSHSHSVNINTSSAGNHNHSSTTRQCMGGTNQNNYTVMRPYGWSAGPDGSQIGTDTTGNHTHNVSGNTGNTGSGESFSIMPPYLAVYIWKRTA